VTECASASHSDGVTSGTYKYSAQVQDAAGNLGQMSSALAVQLGLQDIFGTARNDVLFGSAGSDRLSGIGSAKNLGKGTMDVMTGNGGADQFILGDNRGRFYDDGSNRSSGTGDFARITDFSLSQGDRIQLKGSATEYLQGWINNLQGFSGTGIYHDTNGNGVLDSRDELIALVQNHGFIDQSAFLYF
jgi:Ca2+-binding RTX toxin-like protein